MIPESEIKEWAQILAPYATLGATVWLAFRVNRGIAVSVDNNRVINTVSDRVDGHLSKLTEMVAAIDPAIAAKAAAEVIATAKSAHDDPTPHK
jgi:hypothetical protein